MSDTILSVEDNADDVYILRRALKKAQVTNPVHVVTDGQQAIDYLAGNGVFADRTKFPIPCLIFLDLKLPYRDGFEVLAWIRQHPELEVVPVAILTGSDESRDHQQASALGAHAYLVKPPSPDDLRSLIKSLCTDGLATT